MQLSPTSRPSTPRPRPWLSSDPWQCRRIRRKRTSAPWSAKVAVVFAMRMAAFRASLSSAVHRRCGAHRERSFATLTVRSRPSTF